MMMVKIPTMLTMVFMKLMMEAAVVAMMVNVGPDADLFPCVSGLFLQMEYYHFSKWNITISPNGILVFLQTEYYYFSK